jgi:hypothetical protein
MAVQPTLADAEHAILGVFKHQGARPGEAVKTLAFNDLMVGEGSFRSDELNAALQSMYEKGWVAEARPGFVKLTEAGFAEISGQSGQRMDDFNLTVPLQNFLGWALALDEARFTAVLEHAGHHTPSYLVEKWAQFQENKLAFLWNWTPAFVAAWSAKV